MNQRMTRLAQCQAIGNNKSQLGELCVRFYVVSVQIATAIVSALLARVVISFVNRLSPFLIFRHCAMSFAEHASSSFPVRMSSATFGVHFPKFTQTAARLKRMRLTMCSGLPTRMRRPHVRNRFSRMALPFKFTGPTFRANANFYPRARNTVRSQFIKQCSVRAKHGVGHPMTTLPAPFKSAYDICEIFGNRYAGSLRANLQPAYSVLSH